MRELGRRHVKGVVKIDLSGRVVEVVITADHVGYLHVPIVNHHREIVSGRAIRAGDDQIVQLTVLEHHAPAHAILDHDFTIQRIAKAHDGRYTGGRRTGKVSISTVISRLFATGHLGFTQLIQLFPARVAVIGMTARHELIDHFLVSIHALRLIKRAFVVIEVQPSHAFQNGVHRFRCRSFKVRIFDSEHKLAAVPARIQVAEQSGARTANMQKTGGRWRETGANRHEYLGCTSKLG